ncbi:MAG TPA: hypothetical protein VF708_16590 [Pyrinomonadaceae bacterium]|jgi:hypothetical protein
MKRRQITLADGRYLIFYTFDDEMPAPASAQEGGAVEQQQRREPPVETEREEKPRV